MKLSHYGSEFYGRQSGKSKTSAEAIIPIVREYLQPESVLDVGCGVGTWLDVWSTGSSSIECLGIEGEHIFDREIVCDRDLIITENLANGFELGRQFDLVSSLEVAEHIDQEAEEKYFRSLVKHGNVILFSAAIPHQGGVYHVNEQWQSYWAKKFQTAGFVALDVIRPRIWNDPEVAWWYAQNCLLFVRSAELQTLGIDESLVVENLDELNLVHPNLYLAYADSTKASIKRSSKQLVQAIRRRLQQCK